VVFRDARGRARAEIESPDTVDRLICDWLRVPGEDDDIPQEELLDEANAHKHEIVLQEFSAAGI
jgi:hypothetical protein